MSMYKEPEVNLYGLQSGDSVAGLPIKKRKYLIVRSPSPTRISSLHPKEPDAMQRDQSNSELGTSGEIALIPRGYSLADGRISTDRHVNINNEKSLGQHLDITCSSISEEESSCKRELIPEDESNFQRFDVNSRLVFSQKDPYWQSIGEERSEGKPITSSSSECSIVLNNTELPSASKEPLGCPTKRQNIGGSHLVQENLYQFPAECCLDLRPDTSRGLTLFDERVNVQTSNNVTESKEDLNHLNKSRSHWDLNTTMDAWEGHGANGVNGLDLTRIYDIKSVLCSKELVLQEQVDWHVTSTKCLHVDSKDSKQSSDSLSYSNKEPCPPTKLTMVKSESDHSNLENQMFRGNMSSILGKPVKSEQLEWGNPGDFRTMENHSQLIHLRTPKPEVSDGIIQEGLQTVVGRNRLANSRGLKSEPHEECSQIVKAVEGRTLPHIHELTPELSTKEEVAQGANETFKAIGMVPVPDAKETAGADYMLDAAQVTSSTVAHLNCSASDYVDRSCFDSTAICGEVDRSCLDSTEAESGDNGKINISADVHEDVPNDNEHQPDSRNVNMVAGQTNNNDNGDDFEDGEVRELLVHGYSVEVMREECKIGQVSYGDLNNNEVITDLNNNEVNGFSKPTGDDVPILSCVESTNCTAENPTESKSPCTRVHESTSCIEKKEKSSATAVPQFKTSSASAAPSTGPGKKRCIKVIRKTPRGCSGQKELGSKSLKTDSNQLVRAGTSHETVADNGKGKNVENQECVGGLADLAESNHSKFPKRDSLVRVDKDTRTNHSRIINLAQPCNGATVLCAERGRVPYKSFRTGELHPQGSRDENCMDGHPKLERDRNIDRFAANSGLDFMHMKGRVDNSLDTRRNWDSGRDFSSRHYGSSTGVRFSRGKNITAVSAAELGCNDLVIAPDGSLVNPGKARRHLHGDLESFHHPAFRRWSPDGREGAMPLHPRMVRGPLRVISPDRCFSRGDPDMVVARHEEKLMRDLPDDMMDSLPPHSRSQFQRVHNRFIRGERSFSPVQLRGSVRVPQICPKSPQRSRTPSPCSWPSPRRSLDQFDGHPELFLRRSPRAFRGERIGAPHQRPCFADPMMVRRRGSPPHIPQLPNEMRKMGPLREHDRPRPFVTERSPSGRILQRSTRRFDMIDSREEVEDDEYVGPLISGQFHERIVDDCVSDRRRCRERYGPIRSFRPNDVGVDVERFHHCEDGSRPYRFSPGTDAEFHGKGFRGSPRDFEARIVNRLGNPRRPRRVNEQEEDGSFRCQERGEACFSRNAGLKRGRF